ncbi:hypothetical protein DV736_g4932, partial [Chaetothyriales sp. CBS 134916]
MSIPVEAVSLSGLSKLLAYPPQYPRNPTHPTHERLVLYIVRVPGSQDVFLTPLKPPTKSSISLEAIQTSLYYLHVETAEDDTLRQSLEAERQLEQQKRPGPPILRKPLPPTPFTNYPASDRPPTPPKSYPDYQPSSAGDGNQLDRYVSRGSHLRLSLAGTKPMRRKPLGARPLPSQPRSGEDQAGPSPSPAGSGKGGKSGLWETLLQVPEEEGSEPGSDRPTTRDSAEPSADGEPLSDGSTTITMIRRDPTSGAQWNVGSLRLRTRKSSMALLQPVDMMLTSPGYAKFARNPDSPLTVGHDEDAAEVRSPDSSTAVSPVSGPVFKRCLGFRPLPNDQKPLVQHVRTGSSGILADITNGPSKKVPQVFAFTSPWQGICTFSNGVDGRTLKCKHSLPTLSSQQEGVALPVAELRFNLPWSVLHHADASRLTNREAETLPISQLLGRSTKQQWRRTVQSLKQHTRGPSQDDVPIELARAKPHADQDVLEEDMQRISLKLGREKAGGGFKGNSAKLGKLIIEDEGLKMCDLVVASCMGVWWQHYLLEPRA